MNNLTFFLFIIFFMIHEFEEIIMLEKWMNKNRSDLYKQFPIISLHLRKLTQISTSNFSIIVAEEFLIVSIFTIISSITNNVIYWYCPLAAFSIHLFIHLMQFIIWKKYIPAIATTILCLPYCIWAIYETSKIITLKELIIYAMISVVIGGINLIGMHSFLFIKQERQNHL